MEEEDDVKHVWITILAYFLGLLTPVIVYLIIYFIARLNGRVSVAYSTIFCSNLATGV